MYRSIVLNPSDGFGKTDFTIQVKVEFIIQGGASSEMMAEENARKIVAAFSQHLRQLAFRYKAAVGDHDTLLVWDTPNSEPHG